MDSTDLIETNVPLCPSAEDSPSGLISHMYSFHCCSEVDEIAARRSWPMNRRSSSTISGSDSLSKLELARDRGGVTAMQLSLHCTHIQCTPSERMPSKTNGCFSEALLAAFVFNLYHSLAMYVTISLRKLPGNSDVAKFLQPWRPMNNIRGISCDFCVHGCLHAFMCVDGCIRMFPCVHMFIH